MQTVANCVKYLTFVNEHFLHTGTKPGLSVQILVLQRVAGGSCGHSPRGNYIIILDGGVAP